MNMHETQKAMKRVHLKWSVVKKQNTIVRKEIAKLKTHKEYLHQAREIAECVARTLETAAHDRISGLVTMCLETVFGDEYKFRIDFVKCRGKTEAKLVLIKNGNELTDVLNSDSGGVADVAAFALRVSCLLMTTPAPRKLLVLDEPFKFVSEEYKPAVVELLDKIATDLGVQIIMVTHDQEYKIGKVVTL